MNPKCFPIRSFVLKYLDERDDAQLFEAIVKQNIRYYRLPVARIKALGFTKSWSGKKIVSNHLPTLSQVKELAKASRIKLKIEFGTPHVAGFRTYRERYEALYTMKVIYMPRKAGEVQLWYKNDAQIKDAMCAVVLELLEEKSEPGWMQLYKRYAEEIDRFDATWYSRINKICDDLDVTLTIKF